EACRDFGRQLRNLIVVEINFHTALLCEFIAESGEGVGQPDVGQSRRMQAVGQEVRLDADLLTELSRRFPLFGQRRSDIKRRLLQFRQLDGEQSESLTEVIVQFARDASPFVILNPSQAIPKGAQLGLGLQPLRDVLIDANATNERVSDDQRHSVEIDVDLASVVSASERSGMNRLAV